MKDFTIDQANSIKIINPKTIKIEKLEFRWRITVDNLIEFTIESADQLPDWIIENYIGKSVGWTRTMTVIDGEGVTDGRP